MKRIFFAIIYLICVLALPACAQQLVPETKSGNVALDTWVKMTDDSVILYQQRKHKEAIALARKALDYATVKFGPENPNVAESMDNLATYLTAEGEYKEAQELYQKALLIIEKNFGKDNEYTAIFLNYLSDFYRKIGKDDEAAKLQARAQEIRRNND
jgi:tetratricopeptide (TPR) repeat protein